MAVKIFCCYAHEDEALLNKLKGQLRPLQRQGLIDVWHDRDISAGTEWEREITEQLNNAQIILLLISPDFMDSDYCYSIEMQRAIERHERSEARVIPVILRPVYWQGVLGKLQALPKDAKPAMSSSWNNLDEAFFDVTEGIRLAIRTLPAKPMKPRLSDEGNTHSRAKHSHESQPALVMEEQHRSDLSSTENVLQAEVAQSEEAVRIRRLPKWLIRLTEWLLIGILLSVALAILGLIIAISSAFGTFTYGLGNLLGFGGILLFILGISGLILISLYYFVQLFTSSKK